MFSRISWSRSSSNTTCSPAPKLDDQDAVGLHHVVLVVNLRPNDPPPEDAASVLVIGEVRQDLVRLDDVPRNDREGDGRLRAALGGRRVGDHPVAAELEEDRRVGQPQSCIHRLR
jgi:hypothetical protein